MEAPADLQPAADHAESTTAVLEFLRTARSDHRAAQRRSAAFTVYCLVLFGGMLGVPALVAAARMGRSGGLDGRSGPLLSSLPLWAATLLVLVTLLIARSATWRGPVVVDSATVAWLLSQPLARGPLLLPRLAASATVGAVLGVLSGGVVGFLVSTASAGHWFLATAGGAWAGLGTALAGTGLGALLVRHERSLAGLQQRIFLAAWYGVIAMGALSVVALTHGLPTWVYTTVSWLLPWGWAIQPLTVATVGGAPGWLLAMPMWACYVTAPVLLALRAVPDISEESLRLRATVADRIGASLFSMDLRQARSAMRVTQRRGPLPVRWLLPPHLSWLVVPWRDLLALVRAPGRLGWGIAWSVLSTGALVFASDRPGTTATLSTAVGVWLLYLAAAQLVEPARLESDDMRRSVLLPYGAGSLALWHAVVPCLLLVAVTGLSTLVCALCGWWAPGLPVMPTLVPACVGAALVGAYRGPVPFHLLIGADTPLGNTAPVQTVVWYLRGLLMLMLLAAPVVAAVSGGGGYGTGHMAWLLAVGTGELLWARRTARRLQG